MPRKYLRAIGKRPYAFYGQEQLKKALLAVHHGRTLRWAAEKYGVPRSTISRHMHDKNTGKYGRPPVFSEAEESTLAECISLAGEWGFPLTKLDIRFVVKAHLDRKEVTEPRFKNNLPGSDWTECFLKRQQAKLTERLSQNIKRSRAAVDEKTINEYFDELESSLQNVEPEFIINYDETNLTDDPKRQRVIVRRSCRHPEKILDHSKTSTSVMFSGTGSGHMLPVYINYKAENIYDTWRAGGPPGAKYNRTKSGWFTMEIFEDWFKTIVLPYIRNVDKEKPKVLIGDNLASHVSKWVLDKCVEENIRFVLLPPNSTGLCQPLDVAFFKPLKTKWSQVLTQWKMKNRGVVPKDVFPRLLKSCLDEMKDKAADNIRAGFKGSGLVPLNRQQVLKRLPQTKSCARAESSQEWVASFKEFLQETRAKETQTTRTKKKKLNVKPGASVGNYNPEENSNANKKQQKNRKNKKRSGQESESCSDATLSLHDTDDDIDFIDFDDDNEDNFAEDDVSTLLPFASDPLNDNPPSISKNNAEINMETTFKETPPQDMPSTSKQAPPENVPKTSKQAAPENVSRASKQAAPENVPRTSKQAAPENVPRTSKQAASENVPRTSKQAAPENVPRASKQAASENVPRTSKQAAPENVPRASKQAASENVPRTSKQAAPEIGDKPRDSRLDSGKHENINLDSSTTVQIVERDFVIVKFDYNVKAKKTVEKRFVGQVINVVEDSHVFVKFMRKSQKAENTFVFPQVDDMQLVRPQDVILRIVPLNVSRGRHLFPKFIKEYCCS
ncbi:hypothetical protein O0L34_g6309 [Tuta absoluta]|nr:hypothetical protein O0L34_g6309 [Tuta absoluta]